MRLFHRDPQKSSEKLFNKYVGGIFQGDGKHIHVLDAPFNVSNNYNKLNRKMNYLLDGMRLHEHRIISVDPKFTYNSDGYELCHFIVIYK